MKNNVSPCKTQFYYIKVGFKGVKIIKVCFRDDDQETKHMTKHFCNEQLLRQEEWECERKDGIVNNIKDWARLIFASHFQNGFFQVLRSKCMSHKSIGR